MCLLCSTVKTQTHTHRHTSLHSVTGGEVRTIFVAELVDLPRQRLVFLLLGHIVDIELIWIHNVGYHHPLSDYENEREREDRREEGVRGFE